MRIAEDRGDTNGSNTVDRVRESVTANDNKL